MLNGFALLPAVELVTFMRKVDLADDLQTHGGIEHAAVLMVTKVISDPGDGAIIRQNHGIGKLGFDEFDGGGGILYISVVEAGVGFREQNGSCIMVGFVFLRGFPGLKIFDDGRQAQSCGHHIFQRLVHIHDVLWVSAGVPVLGSRLEIIMFGALIEGLGFTLCLFDDLRGQLLGKNRGCSAQKGKQSGQSREKSRNVHYSNYNLRTARVSIGGSLQNITPDYFFALFRQFGLQFGQFFFEIGDLLFQGSAVLHGIALLEAVEEIEQQGQAPEP